MAAPGERQVPVWMRAMSFGFRDSAVVGGKQFGKAEISI